MIKPHTIAALCIAAALAACGGGGPDKGACPFSNTCATSGGGGGSSGGAPTGAFVQRGSGAFVLKLPDDVDVVRIQGSTSSVAENFAIRADGRLIVNEIVGTSSTPTSSDGTYDVAAGATLEIFQANGVNWTISAASSTPAPGTGIFTLRGEGASVFELPQKTARYLVQASYPGAAENFAVRVAGNLSINVVIGASSTPAAFDGTYLFVGGRVEVLAGPGVVWSFVEQP